MPTNYPTFFTQFFNYVAAVSSDPPWNTEFPLVIDRAEQRLYRDLDLLGTRVIDSTTATSSGVRQFPLPTTFGSYLVVEGVNVITPSSGGSSAGIVAGTRNQVVPISRQFIDITYSSTSYLGIPLFFSRTDATNLVFGPCPDNTYFVEIIGTQRPTPLSSGNSSTILTQLLPDLWFAAAMVEATGYMRDFGSQSDNPQMSMSWEATYQQLLKSALTEELRKKFMSEGWGAQAPNPIATPPRA